MGANIKVEGNSAIIDGVRKLTGARVSAPDPVSYTHLSSAALIAHPLPANHHSLTPQNQNGQTASRAAAWSGPGASE